MMTVISSVAFSNNNYLTIKGESKLVKYKAYINVYHVIKDIEADSLEEAKDLAINDFVWNDHVLDCSIRVEETSND